MQPATHSTPSIDSSFPRDWQATPLDGVPLIAPARHFVYPREVEEVERGALQLIVRPQEGGEFLATFALGFTDPSLPTGVWSCPNTKWLCAVAGGYAYLVDTTDPQTWQMVEYRPVLQVIPHLSQHLLLFTGHQSIVAYGPSGKAWETLRLSWEGVQILEVSEDSLTGTGWDLMTDQEYEVRVDLHTGEHVRIT